jgi:hypothetical protein
MERRVFILVHLAVVIAGWGAGAGLRSFGVAGDEGGRVDLEDPAPAKTGVRTRTPAEVAAGREVLQRILGTMRSSPAQETPSPELSIEELVEKELRRRGIDPAAPAPKLVDGGGSGEEAVEARDYHQVLAHFLARYLNGEHGPDLAHGFRHGRLDALAIYDSLATHLPGAAADQTLRRALYRQLASLDPVGADALLEPMSEAEITRVKYEVIEHPSSPLTPAIAFSLLSSVPTPDDFYGRLRRVMAWNDVTENFLPQFGSDYLHWLEQLPAGVDRDFAALAVAERLPNDDLASHQRLRVLITGSYPLEGPPPR